MSESPFRERRIPADEARRIVARAALEAQRPHAIDDAPAVTEAELARKLADLGLPEEAIRNAMKQIANERTMPVASPDGALRVVHTSRIDGVIAPDRHEDLAEALSNAMGSRGRVEVVGSKLTWMPGGALQDPSVTVRSKDGHTEIRIEETVANRGQQIVGSITLAVFAAMFTTGPGIGLAKMLGARPHTPGLVAFVLAFVLMWAGAAVFGTRRLFRRRFQTRNRDLGAALRTVEDAVRRLVPSSSTSVRVVEAVAAEAQGEAEADAETEAAALDEAAELDAKRVARPS